MVREDLHKLIDGELDLALLSEDELTALQNGLKSVCNGVTDVKKEKKINALKERAAAGEEMVRFKTTPCLNRSADEWGEILESVPEDDFCIIAEYFDWYDPRAVGGELDFCIWKKRERREVLVALKVWTEEDLWPAPLYDNILNRAGKEEVRRTFCDNVGKGLYFQDPAFAGENNQLINKIKEIAQNTEIYFNGELYLGQ